ncbi:FtsB family cell division protein [Collinsella tanakaei]|uniref:FtsB family cell division protein n=1 Tax=Collinsella tanakaei TaxID=626935 RepID=UPI0039F5C765
MNNTSQHNGFSVHNGTAGEPMPPKVKPVSSAYSDAAASVAAKRSHRHKGEGAKGGEAEQKPVDRKQTPTHRRAPKGTARPAARRAVADRPPVHRSGIAEEVGAMPRSAANDRRATRASVSPSADVAGAEHSSSASVSEEPAARKVSGFANKVRGAVSGGAARVKGAAAGAAGADASSRRPARGASSGERSGASAVDEERASRRAAYEARRQSSLMKYANDNRAVRALYDFTSGPYRAVFYVLVVAVIALGVYFPVRDLYIAHRTNGILQEQLAIREKYNESLEKEVNKYLSQEGIEEAAREQGMVMPGETPITVQGADQLGDNGQASSQDGSADGAQSDDAAGSGDTASSGGAADSADEGSGGDAADSSSSEPSTSAEVERAEREVYANSPWYYKVLDSLFFYSGPADQIVKSTGE